MALMTLDSEILRKLAHSGLKTLGSLTDLLELYDIDKNRGLHDAEMRKVFQHSIQSLSQTIRDLRLLAICEETQAGTRARVNWKSLVEGSLGGQFSKAILLTVADGDYDGNGHAELINGALNSFAWFTKQFWKDPVKFTLKLVEKSGSPWVTLDCDFGRTITVDSKFDGFAPFYPMFPKESHALDKSTGLVLCVVKKILELHGGTLIAHANDSLRLEWSCPKSN